MPRPELYELFQAGQSPYFNMYKAGLYGYTADEVTGYCMSIGIPLRKKDMQNFAEGKYRHDLREAEYLRQKTVDPLFAEVNLSITKPIVRCEEVITRLSDYPLLPNGWKGNRYRFFPCSEQNKPMEPWGYTKEYTPRLYTIDQAKQLSPIGWVGQNLLYQPFIVIDIDGRGHGEDDVQTIEFGRWISQGTMVMEDPSKPGSFHVYFRTNRLLPIRHFQHAKIDFMGNATNAAVYLKNKLSNGLQPLELTDRIWDALMEYQKERKVK